MTNPIDTEILWRLLATSTGEPTVAFRQEWLLMLFLGLLMLWAIVLPVLERLSAGGLEFHHAKSADLDPAPMHPGQPTPDTCGVIESPTGTYRLLDEQFSGDVCDVPLAPSSGATHVLKIPRDPNASDLLAKERDVLHTLHDCVGPEH